MEIEVLINAVDGLLLFVFEVSIVVGPLQFDAGYVFVLLNWVGDE